METLGNIRGQLDAFGVGRGERLAVEGQVDRPRLPHGAFPPEGGDAVLATLAGKEGENRLGLGLREVNALARAAELDAARVAGDSVEVVGSRGGAEIHGERPGWRGPPCDALPVEEDLDGRRPGRRAELDLAGSNDDSE